MFSDGRFPDVFKVGQVTPLLKKPVTDNMDIANLRLITNLITIGKILERLLQYQIRRHIQGSPNFGSLQSAYRVLHSTETVMT